MCQAIEDAHGVKWLASKALGCSVFALRKYLQTHPIAADFAKAAEDGLVEFAQYVMLDALSCDNAALREKAAEFVLKQHSGPRAAIQVSVESDDSKRTRINAVFGL